MRGIGEIWIYRKYVIYLKYLKYLKYGGLLYNAVTNKEGNNMSIRIYKLAERSIGGAIIAHVDSYESARVYLLSIHRGAKIVSHHNIVIELIYFSGYIQEYVLYPIDVITLQDIKR